MPERPAWFPEKKRISVFTGDYGSGKTEVAVNYALALAGLVPDVRLADLDIVNPYFRSREALALLEENGIEVITPRGQHLTSELPIILPGVKGLLQSSHGRAVLDVGGDDLGARVLSSLYGSWSADEVEMLLVVNCHRPFTDTVDGVLAVLGKIEAAARMPVTGLVANSHLLEHTSPEVIYRGWELASAVGLRRGIPVRFVAVARQLLPLLDRARIEAPLFPLTRIMVPPWIPREKPGKDSFRL
ncbi:MAG: cobalamin biosynthesis protein CbiA [Deltaproteobacteria bacterium]|nr:cobalamin biosynthesis protein CbiA [Deltaproteobacteria bacterium]